MMSDENKVAVVTGAARGIGRATAISLARRGFAIALADRLVDEMNDAAEEVRGIGVDAMTLPGSVADYTGVLKHGRSILEQWGRIDVLVNNAGVSQPKTLLEISEPTTKRSRSI